MTKITFFKKNGKYTGFVADGHSGFGYRGNDIVCASISILTINTINSISEINKEEIEFASEGGFMIFNLKSNKEDSTQILLKSLVLGLESIQKEYGSKYCKVIHKEENANDKA